MMKGKGYLQTTMYQGKPAMPRQYWSFLKFIGLIGILLLSVGCSMYVASTNERLQSEIMKIQTTLLKRNYLLNNRIKRNALSSSNAQSSSVSEYDEDLMTARTKRSPSNNEPEVVRTPSFGTGVTYKRWGRRDCSGPNNELIYHGIAAGSYYSHTGGPSNVLCLHSNVTYPEGKYVNGRQGNGRIYGMEYRDPNWVNSLFDLSLTENRNLQYHSVPCAVCLALSRYNQLMVPGRETCPEGWHLEYTGYLMSGGYDDKHSSEAICVDDTPHVVPGTEGDNKGAFLLMVEPGCHSLLCEPYVSGRELRCVVCTV